MIVYIRERKITADTYSTAPVVFTFYKARKACNIKSIADAEQYTFMGPIIRKRPITRAPSKDSDQCTSAQSDQSPLFGKVI